MEWEKNEENEGERGTNGGAGGTIVSSTPSDDVEMEDGGDGETVRH